MMTMSAPLQHLNDRKFDWQPGDVVILNDPYDCPGQHLPDAMTFRPAFHRGKRIGFTGAIAHMIDVGGGAPGVISPRPPRFSRKGCASRRSS
jgi:N-methylhydantoinase B/oxoprolinase/acetone carboxylase alpha subunit